jgi:hypothetical protein
MFVGGPLDQQPVPPPQEEPGRGSLTGPAKGGPSDQLRASIDALTSYLEAESDDEDIAEGMKYLAGLQNLLAKQQKEQDGLLQGKATPRALRRANGA